jgi:hypothetical protein
MNVCVYDREREGRRVVSFCYKVVQKVKYDRLFFRFSLTRLIVGDGALASMQLKFQIAIITERCLSQSSFLHLHTMVYVTLIFNVWPSFIGKLCLFFSLLAHFVMINIIVSYDGLPLSSI